MTFLTQHFGLSIFKTTSIV